MSVANEAPERETDREPACAASDGCRADDRDGSAAGACDEAGSVTDCEHLVPGDDDEHDAKLHERIVGEQTAWTGRIFDVERLEVRLPDGRPARRDVVRHGGAVAVVALTESGKIVLVRQYRTALDRVTVEIPAGKLDPGEEPLDAARRELKEETGFVPGRIAYLTTIATSPGFTDELIHLYFATQLELGDASPDDDEFLNVDLVDVHELVDAVLDGEIEDSKTVIGALACDAIAHRLEHESSQRAPWTDPDDSEAQADDRDR